ncbi:hypothetical protein IQ279_10185 [Streptomyces verrucosisporus]|uniref:hypothetical protein n=1 Tax=Streptomyces verrucosisporus TaxID=1695161 RepID=UPI0019CF80D2|nr:hypothetical protein [Streptomyces verrucosisporus]MBN3930001.1 hypothetical protein [Streptomyces verrucosisporus]
MHVFRRIPGLSPKVLCALALALTALLTVLCVPASASAAHQDRALAPAGSAPLAEGPHLSGTPAYTDRAMAAVTAPTAGDGDSPSCSGDEGAPAVVSATGAGDPVAAPEVHGRRVSADPDIHGARAPTGRAGPVTHAPHAFTVLRI